MKYIFTLAILFAFSCNKAKDCPDYASHGCGCYDTGDPTIRYAETRWDNTAKKCFYTDQLGNEWEIDKKYCPCR